MTASTTSAARRKRAPALAAIGCTALALVACESPVPGFAPPRLDAGEAASEPDAFGPPRMQFDPPAPASAVTRVTRITVQFERALASPRVILVAGLLTPAQLRDLARPAVPQALSARAEPALAWTTGDSSVLLVAPLAPLSPGAQYSIGVSVPPVALPFSVETSDSLPVLSRVWPDREEVAASANAAVWCGAEPLPTAESAATLSPAEVAGQLASGQGAPLAASHCVSWLSRGGAPSAADILPALSPPGLAFPDGSRIALEPAVLWPEEVTGPRDTAACSSSEVSLGPGCAEIQDDRILLHPPEAPVLWVIDAEGRAIVRSTRGRTSLTIRPLPADGRLSVRVLDAGGELVAQQVAVKPAAPRPHIVVSEVMANPIGPEPAQEWIELFNDGARPTALGGYTIDDGSGRAILPDSMLEPATFALVVPEAFVFDDGVDPLPAPGTLVLRVPVVGRDGLSNDGEKLTLRDPSNGVVSVFPAMKAKPGVSNARRSPDAPDADPDSFAPSPSGRATPGAPNGFSGEW